MADFKYKKSSEFVESHRSFRAPKPCASQLLTRKFDRAAYDEHRRRLTKVKATVDTSPPKKYMHLQVKLKKIQMEEERAAEIEHDNRLLLAKMSRIMNTSGGIDNRNFAESKTLNKEKRQRELVQIARENQAMLKRIQNRKPNLSAAGLEADFEKHLLLQEAISKSPSTIDVTQSTLSATDAASDDEQATK